MGLMLSGNGTESGEGMDESEKRERGEGGGNVFREFPCVRMENVWWLPCRHGFPDSWQDTGLDKIKKLKKTVGRKSQ